MLNVSSTRPMCTRPKLSDWACVLACMASGVGLFSAPAGAAPPSSRVNFETAIRPLLKRHCHACHGPDLQEAGLRLDLKLEALAGGDSGPAIVPGNPQESLLLELVRGNDPDKVMPPRGETLSKPQIELLEHWISEGAAWPDHETNCASPTTGATGAVPPPWSHAQSGTTLP